METKEIKIGMEIYNRGDMANSPHWGTITKIQRSEQFSDGIEITPNPDEEMEPYWVTPLSIDDHDSGNCSTKIVTGAAHREYRKRTIEAMTQERTRLQERGLI